MTEQTHTSAAQEEIAYVVQRYPTLTTTFLVRELLELERIDVRVHVYSLLPPLTDQRHPEHENLKAQVTYLPQWEKGERKRIMADHFWCLRKYPIRYVRSLIRVVRRLDYRHGWAFVRSPSLARVILARSATRHLHAYFASEEASAALIVHWLTNLTFTFAAHAFDLFVSPRSFCDKVSDAEAVIVISNFNKRVVAERCGSGIVDKIETVRYGLDLEGFEAIYQVRQMTHARARKNDPPKILTVARLVPQKGHKYLADALALLKERGHEFKWLVVGEGPLREDLEEQVARLGLADRTHFTGVVLSPRVKEFLSSADVFVMPCVWADHRQVDGIPVALTEAMASGVPVISTRVSGIPELIEDNRTGLLVEPEDVGALSKAIEALLNDSDLRERLSIEGRRKIIKDFDIVKNVQKLNAILEAAETNGRR